VKILHVPTNTGGHPQGLARAERAIGLQSHAVALKQTYLDMQTDEILWPAGMGLPAQMRAQLYLIWRAVRDYDVVHYNSGQTIATVLLRAQTDHLPMSRRVKLAAGRTYGDTLQRMELSLVRRLRKPYFVTYQGSDARQSDFCRRTFDVTFYNEPEFTPVPGADQHIRDQIKRMTAGAQRVYALNPDLLHVLPSRAEFLPYASVDLTQWQPVWPSSGPPLIVHAPTRRWLKGTGYLLDAVSRLKSDGYDFDFELIEGLSNAEARQRYERAHLLIDQLLAGWYGGLAVELMALGKPVICYMRDEDFTRIPPEMRAQLPIIGSTPAGIYDVLKSWLDRPLSDWQARGLESRRFVERWHDPLKIAQRVAKDYAAAIEQSQRHPR
jgi:hypothetical protein